MRKVLHVSVIALILMSTFVFKSSRKMEVDKYKVIKITGNIIYAKNKKNVSQGDLFPETEKIEFKTPDSKAAIISTAKGRFILAPGADKSKTTVKANLLPASNNVSSRSGAVNNILDLQNLFTGNIVVLNKLKVSINKETYPMGDNSFFYLRYKYKGEEINKKLSYENDKLVFDKTELLMVDGKAISAPDENKYKLFYMSDSKTSTLINEFALITPNDETLKSEINIMLKEVEGKSYSEKVDETIAYLNDFYGKANKNNVMEWLKVNCNLEP